MNQVERLFNDCIEANLCIRCGLCVAICPVDALWIKMGDVPQLCPEKCRNCDLCAKVCPGLDPNGFLDDQLVLPPVSYVAWATDTQVRNEGSSGGVIRALVHYLIRESLADAIICVTNNEETGDVEAGIFREIGTTSIYRPANYSQAFTNIRNKPGRYVLVGLPCVIAGFSRWARIQPKMKERVVLTISLFCSRNAERQATETFLRLHGIRMDEVLKVEYRGGGWPGKFVVWTKGSVLPQILFENYLQSEWPAIFGCGLFTPRRCIFCPDDLGDYADLSAGDAWLPDFTSNHQGGFNLVLARTMKGKVYLEKCLEANILQADKIAMNKVLLSQAVPLYQKTVLLGYKRTIAKILGVKTPSTYKQQLPTSWSPHLQYKPGWFDYLVGFTAAFLELFNNILPIQRVTGIGRPFILKWATYSHRLYGLSARKFRQWLMLE